MKLALGTVQFGLAYGVANVSGQVAEPEAKRIMAAARAAGIDTLDTAAAYGDSEQVLGRIGLAEWRVVTKVPSLPAGIGDPRSWVTQAIAQSMGNLGVKAVDAVLLHRAEDILGPDGHALWAGLCDAREKALCSRIGVSIYQTDTLDVLPAGISLDLIQAPFNIFDRELETSGWADRLAEQGTAIHTRSAFLQGLLLMTPETRPARFHAFDYAFAQWEAFLAETGQSPLKAALSYVLSLPWAERVVVGVDSVAQLDEILAAGRHIGSLAPRSLAVADPELINPRRWSRS